MTASTLRLLLCMLGKSSAANSSKFNYPEARRDKKAVDNYHGTEVSVRAVRER